MAPSSSSNSSQTAVLDFDPSDADAAAMAQTRRLLGQVLAAQGPAGLAKALHVAAPKAASLKHRVACVTCRSRLDPLVTTLLSNSTSAIETLSGKNKPEDTASSASLADGPLPLTAWLAADAGRGLAPAPQALRDLSSLSAFLATFGCSAGVAGSEDVVEELVGRRAQRGSGGVVRCQYHAQNCGGCGFRCGCCLPRGRAGGARKGGGGLLAGCLPSMVDAWALANLQPDAVPAPEKARYAAILRSGTTQAEWRQLGTVDIDNSMCDLFAWLADRGLCAGCVDVVAGLLLELRSMATGICACGKCTSSEKAKKAKSSTPLPPPSGKPRIAGEAPEIVRVQGRLRAICGIYRIQPQTLNGRAIYKKDRAEAYLLYTTLKDWMFSGRPDAGGTRCEGWAYVTDPAEFPDEVCGVWKVSGSRGWEEDPSLVVTSFEGITGDFKELRVGVGFDGGSGCAMTQKLCYDDGILSVPLQQREVLEEILWAPEEPPPGRTKTGACAHIVTADAAKFELRCWLRWLIRDRLDAQRKRVLAQGQVGAALCKLFACAALQQLEEAAEAPPPRSKDKKGRAKKARAEEAASTVEVEASSTSDQAKREAEPQESSTTTSSASSPMPAGNGCNVDGSDGSASTRASSEEPPSAEKAQLALGARRLMEKMGWTPEASISEGLGGDEVAEWREQHANYRQAVQEEREKLKSQFQKWALAR
eukprot:TRINITY_DN63464_c0_g1_i1.p1 TRINITY_DN63464_c0_g1~~TRINITY_DN63464_c0_g1_i1.p1  ORF type:complete len:704 (+),score=176.25 TRINITY_DN63464_c0_g1_i1:57-2168(+)